jgi:hypothetical protein
MSGTAISQARGLAWSALKLVRNQTEIFPGVRGQPISGRNRSLKIEFILLPRAVFTGGILGDFVCRQRRWLQTAKEWLPLDRFDYRGR